MNLLNLPIEPRDRPKRILIVEDDQAIREALADVIGSFGYQCELAGNGLEALAKVKLDVDLVLMDAILPGVNGFQVTRQIRMDADLADLPIVIVTAMAGREERLLALRAGANDFVSKPVDIMELEVRLASLLKMKETRDQLRDYQELLEKTVHVRTNALNDVLQQVRSAHRRIEDAHRDTVRRLAIAAEFKDEGTAAHLQRIGHYCACMAQALKLEGDEVDTIFHASPMHDVGKIGVPEQILNKPGKLTPEEWDIMKQHTTIGARILAGSRSPLLQAGETIAMSHHERWDGTGYPNGLAGQDIPLWGRICAVADVFDALISARAYKPAFSYERALQIVWEGRGKHFDPRLVDVFLERGDEMISIHQQFRNEELAQSTPAPVVS